MNDDDARLERLLSRHPGVLAVPSGALLHGDELLVADRDLHAAGGLLDRWSTGSESAGGVTRVRLNPSARVDVCELAALARSRGLTAGPNHLVHAQPMWWTGPADRPRPAPAAALPPPGPTRRDITVAVLDTGLDPHPWYEGADWFEAQRASVGEVLDADLDHELDGQSGHGTFVAGVVLRHAPSARIVAHRVIGADGVGEEFGVVRALLGLGQVDVVNLSLGCHTYDDLPSPVLRRAIEELPAGTVVTACAGNTDSDRPFWPAALSGVIAVGALDGAERAWFSNHGGWVDAWAQGVAVESSFVRFGRFEGFAAWSGTSFATPAVAGRIAALLASGTSPADAANQVIAAGPTPSGAPAIIRS